VSDFEQILNLISRVGFSFDEGDLTSFLGCWADDGVLNFVSADMKTVLDSVPRQEMEKKLGGAMAGYPHKHFVSLPVVDIDGDEAVARYFTLYPLHPLSRGCVGTRGSRGQSEPYGDAPPGGRPLEAVPAQPRQHLQNPDGCRLPAALMRPRGGRSPIGVHKKQGRRA
jgi:hypothetical protein